MKKLFLLIAFVCLATVAQAQIPSTLGWYEIPNTKLRSVADGGSDNSQFPSIVSAWSGGVIDTQRNRLIVWGGGHNDYFGNEIYALNLNGTPSVERLTDGCYSGQAFDEVCTGSNPAQPQSRHSYNIIAYMSAIDRLYTYSRQWNNWNAGWTFSFANPHWYPNNSSGTFPTASSTLVSAYDPASNRVYLSDGNSLYAYNFTANTYTPVGSGGGAAQFYATWAVDTLRHRIISVGNGQVGTFNISGTGSYDYTRITTTGPQNIVSSGVTGVAYDPAHDRIVCWDGGNTVYILNVTTWVWTTITYPGGPGSAQANGTFGRWQYSAPLDAFILVNDVDQNAFAFRLSGGPPPPPDTQAPTMPTNLTATPVSSVQINLAWTASTDNVGVSGYRVERCQGAGCSNFVQAGTPTGTTYQATGLVASTTYNYRVRATDLAGNLSPYSLVATAATNSTPPPGVVTLSYIPPTPSNGQAMTVTVSGSCDPTCYPRDWVGLYLITASNTQFISWKYFNNSQTPPASIIAKPVALDFIAPAANGTYEFRAFINDVFTRNATSSSFTLPPVQQNLQVGIGKPFVTICSAIAQASPGNTIEVDAPAIYPDEACAVPQNNLTIKAVGTGYAHLKWGTGDSQTNANTIPNGKGILVIQGNGVVIDGLEFSGTKVADENGAGIRYEGGDLTIKNSYFHQNQNGLLGQGGMTSTLTIEDSIFEMNGFCGGGGCAHNLYVGLMGKLVFKHNKSVDSRDGSHTLKSRALVNEITDSFLSTRNSDGSYEIDLSNGGIALVTGNVIEQGANSANSTLLRFGAEGQNPNPALVITNNIFLNNRSAGATFIQVNGVTPSVTGNTFNGGGVLLQGATTDLTNNRNLPVSW